MTTTKTNVRSGLQAIRLEPFLFSNGRCRMFSGNLRFIEDFFDGEHGIEMYIEQRAIAPS